MEKIFKYDEKQITTIKVDEEHWFKAKEITEILEYKDSINAIKLHVNKKYKNTLEEIKKNKIEIKPGELPGLNKEKTIRPGKIPSLKNDYNEKNTIYINEPGLYQLIFKSKMKEAIKFQDWIFEEVLPQLRKTGKYKMKNDYKKIMENKEIEKINNDELKILIDDSQKIKIEEY